MTAEHAEYKETDSLAVQYMCKMGRTPCFINKELEKVDTKFGWLTWCLVLSWMPKDSWDSHRRLAGVTQNLQDIHTLPEWLLEAGWDVAGW